MRSVTATDARRSLHRLLDDVVTTGRPVRISGKKSSAALVSEESWLALQETIHLLSIPGMAMSIREGMRTPVEECAPALDR